MKNLYLQLRKSLPVLLLLFLFSFFIPFLKPVYAQDSNVMPTLYCLGACPTTPVTGTVTEVPSITLAPSVTTPSLSPSSVTSITQTQLSPTISTASSPPASPTSAPSPCKTTSIASLTSTQSVHGHHHRGGFLSFLFQLFFLFLFLLLGQGGLPCPITPLPSPAVSPTVATSPLPTTPLPSPTQSTTIAPTSPQPSTVTPTTIPTSNTTNWSGYVFFPTVVTGDAITGSWNNSSNVCDTPPVTGDSSPWIGFGGSNDISEAKIAQIGSDIWCNRTPPYNGWTEAYPAPPVILTNPVNGGDQFNATITYQGNGTFATTLTDTTQGWTVTTPMNLAPYTPKSVEAILEQVGTSETPPYPAINFNPPVTFKNVRATLNGQNVSLENTPNLTKDQGVNNSIKTFEISPITQGSFTVTWLHK